MEKIEISVEEYNSLKKTKADKELLETQNAELTEKTKEMWENIVKAKDELKEKHKKQLLEISTEKTALETKVKTFTEKLGIGEDVEDVEDLEKFLDDISNDLYSYSKIKEQQEKLSAEAIQKYTDFIKSLDKEWEDYLQSQVDIFWEDVLKNEKALKGFADAKGFKEDWEANKWPIKVWKLEGWDKPWTHDSFVEWLNNWDMSAMNNSIADDLLK